MLCIHIYIELDSYARFAQVQVVGYECVKQKLHEIDHKVELKLAMDMGKYATISFLYTTHTGKYILHTRINYIIPYYEHVRTVCVRLSLHKRVSKICIYEKGARNVSRSRIYAEKE